LASEACRAASCPTLRSSQKIPLCRSEYDIASLYIVSFHCFVIKACARRPGAAASVERRRRERRTLLAGAAGELARATACGCARPSSACTFSACRTLRSSRKTPLCGFEPTPRIDFVVSYHSRTHLTVHTAPVVSSEYRQWFGFAMRVKCTARYLSFHPMAQCVVHALKGQACRARPFCAR
jgi:hypothetical protein